MNIKTKIFTIAIVMMMLFACLSVPVMAASRPAKVTGLYAQTVGNKAYLNWVDVSDADKYEVHVYIPGEGYTNLGSVSKNRATISGLKEGVTYKAKILSYKLVNGQRVKASSYSNVVSFWMEEEKVNKPAKVTGLYGYVNKDTAYLNWNKVSDAEGYEIYFTIPGYGGYSTLRTTDTNYAITGLTTTNADYTAKVIAYKYVNGKKVYSEEYSEVVKFRAESNKPKTVTGLTVSVQNQKAYLNWITVQDAEGYEISVYVPGYGYQVLGTVRSNHARISGLAKNVTYKARVRAYKYVNGEKVYSENYSSVVPFSR